MGPPRAMNELPQKASALETRGLNDDDVRIADYLVPHAQSARTLTTYTDVLRRFQWWCRYAGISSFLDVTEGDALRFRADLVRGAVPSAAAAEARTGEGQHGQHMTPLSRSTVDHYAGIVQTFFDHLMRQGHLTSNPFFGLPKASIGRASTRATRKIRALDDLGTAALVETIALWPRHTARHKGKFQQARWIVYLATKCALSPAQVASEPMSSFKLVSDRWCIENTSAEGFTKRMLVDDAVVDALAEYRTWLRSFVEFAGIGRLPGTGGEPEVPLVGSTLDPRLPVTTHWVRAVLRSVVEETIVRLQRAGNPALAQSLEGFRQRRATAEEVVRDFSREQHAAGDFVAMTQRFHWVQDCPPGPVYVSRAVQSSRLLAGN